MQIYTDKSFTNPIDKIVAFDSNSLKLAFEKIESYKNTHYLLGYIRYEAKNCFFNNHYNYPKPLLYFEVFENFSSFSPQKIHTQYLISEQDFFQNIANILSAFFCFYSLLYGSGLLNNSTGWKLLL